MRRGWLVGTVSGVLAACLWPAAALGAPVVVLGADGHARVRTDRFLPAEWLTALSPPGVARPARVTPWAGMASRSAHSELARLARTHAISQAAYHRYLGSLGAAEAAGNRLAGTRAAQMRAVLENLHVIAVAGLLTPSRLPVLFQTLDRNREWWSTGPLLSSGQRVEFSGSQLVWEYYAGQGIELQELGNFGKADGLYTAGRSHLPQMLQLLSELIPLAARRAGGVAWEYYFGFDGGIPPWTSAMSQGTALEALTRAYKRTKNRRYLEEAHRALPLFRAGPPLGVSVGTRLGRRYLLYSFAPGARVLNGFLQSLIGLYDYAHVSHDAEAARLFAEGDAEARWEVPHYDTGSWSLYQPGELDTLDYHALVTGFLRELCDRVHAPVYCRTAGRFASYTNSR